MGLVGAQVRMPLGEPWRAGKCPYGKAALSTAAACLKGFYLHLAAGGVNEDLGRRLNARRLPTQADRNRALLGHVMVTMPANPLAPQRGRRRGRRGRCRRLGGPAAGYCKRAGTGGKTNEKRATCHGLLHGCFPFSC